MKYRFQATEQFWRAFYSLPSEQKESVRRAWTLFKLNPFDPRLGTHKIHRLSIRYHTTIYSVVIEDNLRALFFMKENTIVTVDLGTHDIYKA